MVRPDRLLDQLAERTVDTFDDARRRHVCYWPLPLVVVGGGADGGALVVGGGAGVDLVGCGGGEVVVALVVVDGDEYVGTYEYGDETVWPVNCGYGKSCTGSDLTASDMKRFQISAGSDPPKTAPYPSTLKSEISALG
jgi:hypothetical protein